MNKITIPAQSAIVEWYDVNRPGWRALSSQKYFSLEQRVELPTSVKRVKPVDLFASATPRTTTQYDLWAPYTQFRLRSWDYRGPLSALYSTGAWGANPGYSHTVCDQKLRALIKNQVANALQSVAEVRQTTSMVSSLIKDVVSSFRNLRSGRSFASIVKALKAPRDAKEKAMANRWLEIQYGWKPLLADIYGITDALATKVNEGIPMFVQASDGLEFSETQNVSTSFDGGPYAYVMTHNCTVRLRSKARFIVRSSSVKTLAQVGITNPALLVWELIPYSFVVDQIIPIGNWLSSLDALVGAQDLVVSRSGRVTNEYLSTGSFGATLYKVDSRFRLGTSADLAIGWPSPKPTKNMLSLVNDLALLKQLR